MRLTSAPPRAAAKIALALALLGLGFLFADWSYDGPIKQSLTAALEPHRSPVERIARQDVAWRHWASTSMHEIEAASFSLAPFGSFGRGGAIEQIGDNIVFLSPLGELGYLSTSRELRSLNSAVDLRLDALRQSGLPQRTAFVASHFRALDMLAIPRGPGAADLYVSHHRFADTCFEVVISKATILIDDVGLRVAEPGWRDFFVAQPCLPPRVRGILFEGNETGGRMVAQGPRHMLFSLGDAEFNGVNADRILAQDPRADYGKILRIDLDTAQASIFAIGFRNPQGLAITRDGTVWATDHGPDGGDEINIIRQGLNYGWPYATYGQDYRMNGPRRTWPLSATPASHEDYERPAIAFVPSMGISNVLQPSTEEFERWGDFLLVGSLYSGHKLLLARIDQGRIVYIEPILIDHVYRDLISLRDGRIAILTDEGELLFLRNAEHTATNRETRFVVTASPETRGRVARGWAVESWGQSPGEEMFVARCLSCHSLSGDTGIGPPLNGVIGRPIGSVADYPYSAALANHGGTWSKGLVMEFLTDPERRFSGTAMSRFGISREDAQALADFLAQQRAREEAR